jgi:hypothetical protein
MSINLLPKITYDFSIQNENPKPILIPDLMIRFNLKLSEAEKKISLFNYVILDGETPEIISHKFYNTMDYHWIIMLVNERFDYLSDFPLKDDLLLDLTKQKYGVDNADSIHHYEDDRGNVTDDNYYDWKNTTNTIPVGTLAEQPIYQKYYKDGNNVPVLLRGVPGIPVSNYQYEIRENDIKRHIKLVKPAYIQQYYKSYSKAVNAA